MTWWNEPTALILVFGAFCAGFGGCIAIICSNIRMSRCKYIKCCCLECLRENLSAAEYLKELEHQQKIVKDLENQANEAKLRSKELSEKPTSGGNDKPNGESSAVAGTAAGESSAVAGTAAGDSNTVAGTSV
jgi:hypothetical protein